jgi:F-type H+-transporting ATPase subunit alpha
VAGTLKLAYSQFEELESFARFGTRLDDSTRKIIEHGRRIRACLKQPESQPVSLPDQISVLLALAAGLLDAVPLDKVTDAEQALCKSTANIPADIVGRFTTAERLSDADRAATLKVATQALQEFQPATPAGSAATPAASAATPAGPAAPKAGSAAPPAPPAGSAAPPPP